MVKQIFWETVSSAPPSESLKSVVIRADQKIGAYQKSVGFSFRADELAGTCFALARITEKTVEIFQGGDNIALWMLKDFSVGFTPNRAFPADKYEKEIFAGLVKKHEGDRKKARVEFTLLLKDEKMANINQNHPEAYPVANGQLNINICFEKTLPVDNLNFLLLFTDGFIPFEDFNNPQRMWELAVFTKENELTTKLDKTRGQEKGGTGAAIAPRAEATALAVWF